MAVRIHLLSFGPWRSLLPADGEWRNIKQDESVAGLLSTLEAEGRFTAKALRSAAVAVNQEYAQPAHVLADGDEVAILPPVSGGRDEVGPKMISIVWDPIAMDSVMAKIKAGGDGAVCVFDGIVRNNTRGRETLHLDYEGYEEMALRQMEQLRAEAVDRFSVREVAIVHRLGRLFVGETSVLIVVASAHRGAAFDACRWVIDTLKKTVPIWKHEQFVDGAVWSDGEPFPVEVTGARS
ncbi:MAG: molybdenum cofactor biosynthesis protein [Janthinobacterium lividum]